MDNLGDAMSRGTDARDKDRIYALERKVSVLETQVRILQSLVDQLRGTQGSYGPIPNNYSILRTYDSGYHSQVVGHRLDRLAKSQDMQQPMGWSGYFGDAGGPLK